MTRRNKMKGIMLSSGTAYVTDGYTTLRVRPSGEVEISSTSYFVLEHDLSTESPSDWSYMLEGEIEALPCIENIRAELSRIRKILKLD